MTNAEAGSAKRSPFASPDSINSLNLPRSPQSMWGATVWGTMACISAFKERLRANFRA